MVNIRVMAIADYGQVYGLWRDTPGMGLNTLDDSQAGIEKYLRRNPTTCFVAEDGGALVGAVLAGHDGRRGYIYHTARGLVSHAMEALDKEGINKAALVVFKRNEGGNGFWEKLGFTGRGDLVYRDKGIRELVRIDT